MKYWEAIKALTEDPTQEFEAKLSPRLALRMRVTTAISRFFRFEVFYDNELIDQSSGRGAFNGNVALHYDWQPVRHSVTDTPINAKHWEKPMLLAKRDTEAMDKQEPMKPIIEQGAPSYYGSTGICRDYCVCPKCGEEVGRGDDRANYCPQCGQKIDWSEEQMSELRLCPYCSGDARILPEGDYHEVTCEVCGVYVQGHTYEDAVNAWNCNAEIYDNTED